MPLIVILIILIVLGLVSLKKPEGEQMSLLFLIHAKEAKVTKDDSGWKLVMADTDSRVEFFSDRPKRLMGQGSLGQFLLAWEDLGFAEDPPNAAISMMGEDEVMMVTLKDPIYNSDTRELSFYIKSLMELPESFQNLNQQRGEFGEKQGDEPTIFIDNAIISSKSSNQTLQVQAFMSGTPIQEHTFHIRWKGSVLDRD